MRIKSRKRIKRKSKRKRKIMNQICRHLRNVLICAFVTLFCSSARADEGMWLLDHPPRELLKKTYNFDATDAWLSHVMHSAVRFNSGGSGSFVSADGLVM